MSGGSDEGDIRVPLTAQTKRRMDSIPFISFYLKKGLPNTELSHWTGRLKTLFGGWRMLRGHTFCQSQVQLSVVAFV